MATRPIVPRANGEGSLGVTSKYWGNTFTQKMNGANAVDMAEFSTATLRQPSNAQSVGDIRYHATLPAGWYLECTTAGNTGSGALTITSPTVGGTVSDGTVTWTIRKNASTQDLSGYLPLSGGAMTGGDEVYIARNTNTGVLSIFGGTRFSDGGYLTLFGENVNSNTAGGFQLVTKNAENILRGKTDATLKWNNNSLDKSAVVAESLGTNGYRKYASGLIEQWGRTTAVVDSNYFQNITFPISFQTSANINVFFIPNNVNAFIQAAGGNNTVTQFLAYDKTENLITTGISVSWRAIGY